MRKGPASVSAEPEARPLLRRAQRISSGTVITVALYELLEEGSAELNVVVLNGDMIDVPQAREFSVLGFVERPGPSFLQRAARTSSRRSRWRKATPRARRPRPPASVLQAPDRRGRRQHPARPGRHLERQQPEPATVPDDPSKCASRGAGMPRWSSWICSGGCTPSSVTRSIGRNEGGVRDNAAGLDRTPEKGLSERTASFTTTCACCTCGDRVFAVTVARPSRRRPSSGAAADADLPLLVQPAPSADAGAHRGVEEVSSHLRRGQRQPVAAPRICSKTQPTSS